MSVAPLQIDYDYSSVPTILKFSLSDRRIRGLMGPFGSGKSSGCLMEVMRRASLQTPGPDGIRRIRCAIVRNSYPQLRDTTIKTVLDWFPPRYFGQLKVADHEYIITAFDGMHVELLFRALDKPEHVSNLLSLELTMAWLNEAREIPRAIFDAIDGRINRYPAMREGGCTWAGIIMDTNPPDEDSWWYKYFEEDKPENAQIFKQPSGLSAEAENLPNLPEGYYRDLMIGKPQEYVDVYIHGKYGYTKDGKPVYNNWNDRMHVAERNISPVRGIPLIIGIDFGLTPSAAICQQTVRGHFIVLDEVISESMGVRQFAENMLRPLLARKYPDFQIIGAGDPAGTQRSQSNAVTCFEELKAAGLKIIPARTNALAARVGAVDTLLGRIIDGSPCFLLSPNCKVLRKGFNGGYKFQRLLTQYNKYSDKPAKNHLSHIQDALQYAALYVDGQFKNHKKTPMRPIDRYVPASGYAGY
jgi:hypothetical protein